MKRKACTFGETDTKATMKTHLAKLLFAQYKQDCLFLELDDKGVSLMEISVDVFEVVLDIVGFPPDRDDFVRDWLHDQYFKLIEEGKDKPKEKRGHLGLMFKEDAEEEAAKIRISNYIDWLYSEYEDCKKEGHIPA